MQYPDWVLKHKRKNTEIRKFGNSYYLYEIKSVWDPEKKRARKVTVKYLGKITPDGIVRPRKEREREKLKNVEVKEYGATKFIMDANEDVIDVLKSIFPDYWGEILAFSIARLMHCSAIKNVQFHYSTSYLSNTVKARSSPKSISKMLKDVGMDRKRVKEFLSRFIGHENIVVDVTYTFTKSENAVMPSLGYNSLNEFTPQINLLFFFALDKRMPAYFRLIPGSVRDVSSLVLSIRESGVKNAVLIGDKGFYSERNVEEAEKAGLYYVFPLKRNSRLVDYSIIERGDKREFDGYFIFEKRVIWYYSYTVNKRRIVVFLDEKLRVEEERDFLLRDNNDIEEFYGKLPRFGTVAVITNLECNAEKIYSMLKSRVEIEQMFDSFKNVLNADRTYLRDDHAIAGWMFVNFVSLLFYYRIYNMLSEKGLLKRMSVKDVLLHLSRVYRLKIGDEWYTSEVPRKTREIVEKLGVNIT